MGRHLSSHITVKRIILNSFYRMCHKNCAKLVKIPHSRKSLALLFALFFVRGGKTVVCVRIFY